MRERVEAAIEELGYRPSVAARALRGSSYRLGLEIPHVSARFMTQIVEGAKVALAGTPYQLVLAPADGPEYGTIESLADGLVDGIIAVSPLVDPAWLENLARRVPIVMLGRHDRPEQLRHGGGRRRVGARAAMRHLLELGHRRIAHLTEPEAVTAPGSGTPHSIRLADLPGLHGRGRPHGPGRGRPAGATDADGGRRATAELLARARPADGDLRRPRRHRHGRPGGNRRRRPRAAARCRSSATTTPTWPHIR